MTSAHVEVYEDDSNTAQCWRWRLCGGNGEIVAYGEAHTTKADAYRAAYRASELFAEALRANG